MKHDHPATEGCSAACPNRVANLNRSTKMRCTRCGRINCPTHWLDR